MTTDSVLREVDAPVRAILERALEGREPELQDILLLDRVTGPGLAALCAVADALRQRQVGPRATYVVNRNINFTNVCIKACRFCAFSRTGRSEQGYFLGVDEIVRRAVEAWSLGATEVCIQAGLAPGIDPGLYADICRAIKRAAPELAIHAFSPEEIKYGAGLARTPVRDYLEELKEAGLGSLPGTSAEILDDELRARIAPGRIRTVEWLEIVRTAHSIGLPTTATMMYGHVESSEQRARHLTLLRSVQGETGGFTEFVPLSFVYEETPMYKRGLVKGLRSGPTSDEVTRVHALARLVLGATFRNVQVSWVKVGLEHATALLRCGANDLGGTLINESISTSAGAAHGQLASPRALRRAIRDAGLTPAQRDTRYRVVRAFETAPEADAVDALDRAPVDAFGSYDELTRDERFRFQKGARSGSPR
ncbi:MAG TPA: 5-amino-6-(D-ribitylamino)uracil--L-tyrosine 4-hydroxyphenyl transferase CofH [Polyangiaceae bacterium]